MRRYRITAIVMIVLVACFLINAHGGAIQNADNALSPIVLIGASYAADLKIQTLAGRTLINKGVAGEQSFEMLKRFEKDVIYYKPESVIIWGFINDIFRTDKSKMGDTLKAIEYNYIKMVGKAREHGIEPVLATEVTMSHRPGLKERVIGFIARLMGKTSYQQYINKHVMEVNQWLKTYADENKLILLDLQAILSRDDNMRKMAYAQKDGSHISVAGYNVISEYIKSTLKAKHK